jgi:hypothetical protein
MKKGDLVSHPEFGDGTVLDVYPANNYPVHVLFDGTSRTFKLNDPREKPAAQG